MHRKMRQQAHQLPISCRHRLWPIALALTKFLRRLLSCQLPPFPFKMIVSNQQLWLEPFHRQRGDRGAVT